MLLKIGVKENILSQGKVWENENFKKSPPPRILVSK